MIAFSLMTALCLSASLPETTLGNPGEKTSVTAQSSEFRRADGVLHAEGGVVVNSGDVWLRADDVEFDVATKAVSAQGNLVVIDGNLVVTGDSGSMTVGQPETMKFKGARLYQKEKPISGRDLDKLSPVKEDKATKDTPKKEELTSEQTGAEDASPSSQTEVAKAVPTAEEDASSDDVPGESALGDAAEKEASVAEPSGPPEVTESEKRTFDRSDVVATCSPSAFAKMGQNALVIQAGQLERGENGEYRAQDLRLTSCVCKDDDCPAWSLGARSADVTLGEGAWLYWPTFRINNVPVLGFPIIYVPLSERRTGLLFPKIEFASGGGIGVDLPFFLTLGRSFDLTFTPGFLSKPVLALSNEATQRERAWGPRGSLEFRYAPHESTRGNIKFGGILDRGFDDLDSGRVRRGFRGRITARHRSNFRNGLGLYVDLAGLSDARYLTDVSDNLLAGATTYLPSSARVFWRADDVELTLASRWFQDLATARSAFFPKNSPLLGSDSPATYQRPALFLGQMPLKRLVGPLHFGGELLALHARPIGMGGSLTQSRLDASMRRTTSADYFDLTRVDLAPKFWFPFLSVGPIRGELTLGARADFSAYNPVLSGGSISGNEGDNESTSNFFGRAFADLRLWTELSRVFGSDASALRHAITPIVQIRASTREFGNRDDSDLIDRAMGFSDVPTAIIPLDELDFPNRAADPRLFQGVVALRNRLMRPNGDGRLSVTVGQGYDFTRLGWGETFGDISTSFRWVSMGAGLRYDPELKALSMVQGRIRLSDPRGDYLSATYDLLRGSGTSRMNEGEDDLLGAMADPSIDSQFQQINLGVGITIIPQLALSYGIRINPTAQKDAQILLHSGTLRFLGRCDCWSVDVGAQWAPVTERWSLSFLLNLKNLGSFGNK